MANDTRVVMTCPINGKTCKGGRREDYPKDETGTPQQCRLWTEVAGMNPQTGEAINTGDCAVAWLPILMIENAQMTRHATASIDKNANILFGALPGPIQERVMKQMPSLAATLNQGSKQLVNGKAQA